MDCRYPLLISLLWSLASIPCPAELRSWTSRAGSVVEAELVREEGDKVVLRRADGRDLGIGIASLSEADQDYVRSWRTGLVEAIPVTHASPLSLRLGGVDLVRGEMTTFTVPLPPDAIKALDKEKNTVVSNALVGIAVPETFDPAKPARVLVVSATSDANSSSIDHGRQYQREALARGWVVLAADGPGNMAPLQVTTTWRWSMIRAGLDEMHRAWPASSTWSYAAAGFSGGAKRSGYIAALLAEAKYTVIGIFLGGCNEDMASKGLLEYKPPRFAFLKVPIFQSNGTTDQIATVDHARRVNASLNRTGFKDVRLETYEGGHDPHPPHTDMALAWYEELASVK